MLRDEGLLAALVIPGGGACKRFYSPDIASRRQFFTKKRDFK
jgi:hypothetical protein